MAYKQKIRWLCNKEEAKLALELVGRDKRCVVHMVEQGPIMPRPKRIATIRHNTYPDYYAFEKEVKRWIRTACNVGYLLEFIVE